MDNRIKLIIAVDDRGGTFTTGPVKVPFSDKPKTSGNSTSAAIYAAQRLADKLFQPGWTISQEDSSLVLPTRSYFKIEGVPHV